MHNHTFQTELFEASAQPLPKLSDQATKTYHLLSLGMGWESVAILLRWLFEPEARACYELLGFALCRDMDRKAYPTDVSDEEWSFVAPYLSLMTEDAPQREHSLREVFNGLRWVVRSGSAWRLMPHDLPPWAAVYQQSQRWFKAGVFEAIVDDLRALLRVAEKRNEQPCAVIIDSRTLQSTPESGGRAGYDGAKRRKGNKVHIAVDTLGYLLGLVVTPANQQDRTQVQELAQQVQQITGEMVEIAFVDQGYTGKQAA